jgi:hypothetical protein
MAPARICIGGRCGAKFLCKRTGNELSAVGAVPREVVVTGPPQLFISGDVARNIWDDFLSK